MKRIRGPSAAGAPALLILLAAVVLAAPAARAQGTPDPEPVPIPETSDSTESVAPPEPAVEDTSLPLANAPLTTHRKVRLDRQDHNVIRTGPGNEYALAGVYPKGASFLVIAKSGDWYNVRLSPTETGWVHRSLCHEFDDLSDLEFKPNPRLYTRTGTFVLCGYGGAYAFDRKSNSLVLGGRLGYYVFDRIQVEGGLSWTHVRRPAEIVESLFGLSLEAEDFQMLFYNLNATWELLPGRQMVPFLTTGVGSAIMRGDTEPSFNVGAGTTLFLSKRLATRWEFRDYFMHSGPRAAREANQNVEFILGTLMLF